MNQEFKLAAGHNERKGIMRSILTAAFAVMFFLSGTPTYAAIELPANLAGNSKCVKLSKGDLALAKICAYWPDARDTMKAKLKEWSQAGYSFSLDWLLRSVNTALTGEAKFQYLHDKSAE